MSNTDLTTGIDKEIHTGKYSQTKYTEEQIMRKIRRNEINFNNPNFWIIVANDTFGKITPGVTVDRSPLASRDPRKRKKNDSPSHSTTT